MGDLHFQDSTEVQVEDAEDMALEDAEAREFYGRRAHTGPFSDEEEYYEDQEGEEEGEEEEAGPWDDDDGHQSISTSRRDTVRVPLIGTGAYINYFAGDPDFIHEYNLSFGRVSFP